MVLLPYLTISRIPWKILLIHDRRGITAVRIIVPFPADKMPMSGSKELEGSYVWHLIHLKDLTSADIAKCPA